MSGIPNVTHADPCTCAACNAKANRIAAFGAIRRAAAEARRLDCPCGCHGDSYAIYIRRAIRAAIGSPKA